MRQRRGNTKQPGEKVVRACIKGLRLISMESNGLKEDGTAEILIQPTPSAKALLSHIDANQWIVNTPHNWLICVVAILRDIHRNYESRQELEVFKGTKIDDTAAKVMPMLDTIKDGLNEKMIVDYGWFAEILPTKRFDPKQDEEKYKAKAEDWIENWIINRHIEQESVA